MRTLKKSLALVLALVMVLGLGVVGASADNKLDDYTDAKDIGDAYVEAVGVMTGLEIVDGMTETTIDPTATYTREQAAKIIAYMVLGKSAADSLTCTVAPFDDVAADRWSAGYISFCVEQGIIDGMTDTTFEPTGTLTGFQWAKMLLSAVGFNAKGEFTGDSWSLNTARVAHSVGLFTGDAAGADHVALQRQQAMLYAFNTLTGIGQVVWSEALGDYIYGYGDFVVDHYTPETTLGVSVFNLHSVEGIVVDNEGMGASDTKLNKVYDESTKSYTDTWIGAADTGLDLYYHAVRVWYVDDAKNTGVYTTDLASSTVYKCDNDAADKALDQYRKDGKDIAEIEKVGNGTPYVTSLIDNSAYAGAANDIYPVSFKVTLDTFIRNDSVKGTYLSNEGWISNNKLMSDVSDLTINQRVIVLKAGSAYYMSPVTATTGNVESYNTKTDTITLTDGTVLAKSNLCTGMDNELNELETILVENPHSTPAYTFVLDTHGHYISLSNERISSVAYYTGTWKYTSQYGDWQNEQLVAAQFLSLEDGTEFTVPVTESWALDHEGVEYADYYDTYTSLYIDPTYEPEQLAANQNPYADTYYKLAANGNFKSFTISENQTSITDVKTATGTTTLKLNPATVKFVIANGIGSSATAEVYNGIDELLDAYSKEFNVPFTSVNLTNAIATVTTGLAGEYVTSIFAFSDVQSLGGGYVYFPEVPTDWTAVDSNYYTMAGYLNGELMSTDIKVKTASAKDQINGVGFYSYTIDADGMWNFKPVAGNGINGVFTLLKTTEIDNLDANTYEVATGTGKSVKVSADVVVVDVTNPEEDDNILTFDELLERTKTDEAFTCYYMDENADGVIALMYVQTNS